MLDFGNYGPPTQRRRRGGGMPMAISVVALCLLAGVLIVTRPWQSRSASATVQNPASAGQARQSAVTSVSPLSEGACIDSTASTVTSFAASVRGDLASAVASLGPTGPVPTKPIDSSGSGPLSVPQPGVSLRVRQVDTASLSSTPTLYNSVVSVPGVFGLTAREPAPGSNNYTTAMSTWNEQYNQVSSSRAAARSAAAKASKTLAGLPLDDNQQAMSAISACVSGLLTTVPHAGSQRFLLASDLQENETAQLTGSFHGAPLLIIQACDSGDVSYCGGLLSRFKGEMRRLDVGPITVVRPENAQQAIYQWVHGLEVTS